MPRLLNHDLNAKFFSVE